MRRALLLPSNLRRSLLRRLSNLSLLGLGNRLLGRISPDPHHTEAPAARPPPRTATVHYLPLVPYRTSRHPLFRYMVTRLRTSPSALSTHIQATFTSIPKQKKNCLRCHTTSKPMRSISNSRSWPLSSCNINSFNFFKLSLPQLRYPSSNSLSHSSKWAISWRRDSRHWQLSEQPNCSNNKRNSSPMHSSCTIYNSSNFSRLSDVEKTRREQRHRRSFPIHLLCLRRTRRKVRLPLSDLPGDLN